MVLPHIYNGKNKTFFFANVELVRFVQGVTYTGTVPRPQELAGDFSQTRNAAGNLIQIFDPTTTTSTNGGFTRTAFPGNIIPANRIDPVIRNVAKYFPAPNTTGNPITGVNNYNRTAANQVTKNTFSIRGDHYFSERNRLFSRFSYDNTPYRRAAPFGADDPGSPGNGPQIFGRRNAVIEDDHTFAPDLLGTFRYSITRLSNFRNPFSYGFDITRLGFPASLQQQVIAAFPAFAISGFNVTNSVGQNPSLGATDLIALANDTHTFQAQITKVLNRHTFKTGFDYRIIKFNTLQTPPNSPGFTFTNAWTQGPNPNAASATAGYSLASFLLGADNTGTVTPAPSLAMQTTYYATFLQDDFKVTNNLTLNLGIRYEFESPRTDRYNQLSTFDYRLNPALQALGLNLAGALTFPGVNGNSRFNSNPDRNNFAPRLGFAYRINSSTVLRGGGGIFYGSSTGIGTGSNGFGSSGFSATSSQVTSLNGLVPLTYVSDPFPSGLNQPTGSRLGPATQLGQTISFTDTGNVLPYSEQWNFNVQHQLPGAILLEVGYVGSHGLKLPTTRTLNQLPDSALALGNSLRDLVPNPFYGQISTGILANPTVSRAQLLRPFPQFDGVSAVNSTWASSVYHALEAKVEKRYSNGLTIMDLTRFEADRLYIGTFSGETVGGGVIEDWSNLRAAVPSPCWIRTHHFIANAVYVLLFSVNTFTDGPGSCSADREVGAITSLFSGGPIGITSATNNTFSQGGGQRPNWTGKSPALANPTPDRWIDPSQFSNPPAYTFGNVGRTLSG